MKCNFNRSDVIARKKVLRLTSRVDVFGRGIALSGRSDMSQAVAEPPRLQLCAVLVSLDIK
jgi:hypothetical protein